MSDQGKLMCIACMDKWEYTCIAMQALPSGVCATCGKKGFGWWVDQLVRPLSWRAKNMVEKKIHRK